MDPKLKALLDRYHADPSSLSDEELGELREGLQSRAQEIGDNTSDQAIAELREIADTVDDVRTHEDERATAAEARETEAADLRNRINATSDQGEDGTEGGDGDEGTGDGGDGTEGTPPADGDEGTGTEDGGEGTDATPPAEEGAGTGDGAGTEPGGEGTQPNAEAEEDALAAGGSPPTPGQIGRTPTGGNRGRSRRRTEQEENVVRATITAAGDVPGVSAGDSFESMDQLGEAFARKAEALLRSQVKGSKGMQSLIASINFEYPEHLRIDPDNPELSEQRVQAFLEQSRVAAGGICAPTATSYDVPVIADPRRPIRDALPRFGADRGGLRFMAPPRLTDLDDATGVWTHANDIAAATDENVRKACLRIDCGEWDEVIIDALYACLTVGNFQRRTFAENFRAWWEIAQANVARLAENKLWDAMAAAGTLVTAGRGFGAARDVLTHLDRASAGFRSRHRTTENYALRFFAPDWLRGMIRSDLVRGSESIEAFTVADATIQRFFTERNITPVWSPDAGGQHFGPETGGALDEWPDTIETILTHEGAFTYLDGGELDFGVEIRDTEKIKANDVDAFFEIFENVAYRGHESLTLQMTVCPDGTRAQWKSYDPCANEGS